MSGMLILKVCQVNCVRNHLGAHCGFNATGACEGSIACSTCHVTLDAESYDKLEEPEDDENDMLDLAFGLSDT